MRKGHRRTQSAYIASSSQLNSHEPKQKTSSNQIFKLLEASNDKISSKVISYEKLQVNNDKDANFLKFGNYTIKKYNQNIENKQEPIRKKPGEQKLICIPETNKSSQISSQNLSRGQTEDDLPPRPLRKHHRNKRGSDFPSFQNSKHAKTNSQVGESSQRSQNKSLTKNQH